jgi:hypothetical protein
VLSSTPIHDVQERPAAGAASLIIGLMAAISLGLMVFALKTGAPLRYSDERQYLDIAMSLRDGDGFTLNGQPTAYRPPAWPVLLAIFLALGVSPAYLPVVSVCAMIGAGVLAALVGVKICGNQWGALAGVAVLVYPLNIYSALTLYPQAFATLLVLTLWLLVLGVTKDGEAGTVRRCLLYVSIGLVASLLALSVPTLAFTGLAVVVWMIFAVRGDRVRAALCTITALVVPIAVWTVRNIIVLGAPVVLSTSTGVNLLIGNNPTATGSSGVAVDISGPQSKASTMSEVHSDAYLRQTAIDWIIHHPVDSATLFFAKVANYFSAYNAPVTVSEGGTVQRFVAYLSWAVLVILVLVRLFLRKRLPLRRTERVFVGLFLANALVMAVFFTRTRFRQPLDSILLVEAAIAIVLVVSVIMTTRRLRT